MSNHPKFLKRLNDSKEAVVFIADHLSNKGYPVRINGTKQAVIAAEWEDFVDTGDLEIGIRIEVKRLSVEFTNEKDWPFGSKFIVCGKEAWDRAQPKPATFYILSASMSHMAIVNKNSKRYWFVETRKDSGYGISQEFYFCPLKHVRFKSCS